MSNIFLQMDQAEDKSIKEGRLTYLHSSKHKVVAVTDILPGTLPDMDFTYVSTQSVFPRRVNGINVNSFSELFQVSMAGYQYATSIDDLLHPQELPDHSEEKITDLSVMDTF